MAYQALYRKYRPQQFKEVYGQDQNTVVLRHQIKEKTFGHAYLFTGTRGTGKTSTAKIFSRAINCLQEEEGEPCNQCAHCEGILAERIFDVIEMDAASNNSVDDIRELKEKAVYAPTTLKYKVYIIDEAHMLSKEAFNALLKILEEPPKHLVFILATTEPNKLPQTILSRCQRFDFRRITGKDIVACLTDACKDLEIVAEPEALEEIAAISDGALRDAFSLLERCIYADEKRLTYEGVIGALGLLSPKVYEAYVQGVADKDAGELLHWISLRYEEGADFQNVAVGLIAYFRKLLLYHVAPTLREIEHWPEKIKEGVKTLAPLFSEETLKEMIILFSEMLQQMKYAKSERLLLESTSLKLLREGTPSVQNPKSKKTLSLQAKKPERELAPLPAIKTPPEEKVPQTEEDTEGAEKGGGQVDEAMWQKFMEFIRQKNKSLHAFLREARFEGDAEGVISLVYTVDFAFHKQAVSREEKKEFLEAAFLEHMGLARKLMFKMADEDSIQEKEQQLLAELNEKFHGAEIEIKS